MTILSIPSKPPVVLRVIGAVILVGGLYFLKTYFFTDLIATVKDPDFLPMGLLGMVIILAMGLAITAAGLIALLMTKVTVINIPAGTVTAIKRLWLFNSSTAWPIKGFTKVQKIWHAEEGDHHSTGIFNVYLLRKNGSQVCVDVFTQEAAALALARQLSESLHLPLQDTTRDEYLPHDPE